MEMGSSVRLISSSMSAYYFSSPLHPHDFELDQVFQALEDEVTCSVCRSVSLPPIFCCDPSRISCSTCASQTNYMCTHCNQPYLRNIPLETKLQNSKFYCVNLGKGCHFASSFEEMRKHNTICGYRRLRCYIIGYFECDHSNLGSIYEYVPHLILSHGLSYVPPEQGSTSAFSVEYKISNWTEDFFKANNFWLSPMFKYDEIVFIPRVFNQGDMIYFKMDFFALDAKTFKFLAKIRIQDILAHNENNDYTATVQASSITNLLISWPLDRLPRTGIGKDLLKNYCYFAHGLARPSPCNFVIPPPIYKWKVRYEISKVDCS